ncbi:uncharacterized protein SCDLUD_002026 [Saccharomycodes ludwigii]|uniref:uncharacterized protein n=1 Tax=Saccharomycodes ludwigii TaxID=36035 RepID=UPI001E836A76|nr:hypothetical protein SCDLUD_002026 [Saccharomycodes ludwigii]KAH3902211.1 hypothetical protein SCDLUD_002026 [Saccharomycodes ludwigii]
MSDLRLELEKSKEQVLRLQINNQANILNPIERVDNGEIINTKLKDNAGEPVKEPTSKQVSEYKLKMTNDLNKLEELTQQKIKDIVRQRLNSKND